MRPKAAVQHRRFAGRPPRSAQIHAARRAVRDKIAVPEHKAPPIRRAGRRGDPAVRKAIVHRAQGAVLKQGVRPAKDKIDVPGDLAGVVILCACPAGCQPARAQKAVLLPLLLRQRGAKQGVLIAQQPHAAERRPGAVHIGCDGLSRLCARACIVFNGHILHPQLLPAEKGGVAAEGVGGTPVRVRQLAAIVPYQPGGIHARARKGDILFLTNQFFPVNARRDADDRRAVVGHR